MLNKLSLVGKVALVTGGSRSIGAEIVKTLAAHGAIVAFTYHSSQIKAEELIKEIEFHGGQAIAIKADSGNPEMLIKAIEDVAKKFHKIDILINNAGISHLGSLESVSISAFERLVAVNIMGVFLATRESLKHMGKGGRIINIGSTMVNYSGFSGASIYILTKGAITGFSRGLVRELGVKGITINTIHPGPTNTDMNPIDGPIASLLLPNIPVGRYGEGIDIANSVLFLASEQASYISGAELSVDGGFIA
ncbi:3-oxoacyl-ACP reductase family protein [Acinetobacter guillouiae]|uniref:3-oxoacyl-[acyl-carrier-protein] reductase n=1 Tax=Acinetobacter guillouiae NIPH 991 TaxID=1217656 RepID=N8Y920_ACIGI|nr:3-oxoacyl-ACP reductase family protein [Acinetobacter guillouiae]ENV16138.1 hypothetical protein F964_03073 [Acinetobacter guillouiae NIPH 991]MDO6642398.1 3-oxoacyl-ACP reductase family protein [Acinetobacter guillouiae]BAP37064.1 BdcA protein homolog [Acinetobacter guillouiae]